MSKINKTTTETRLAIERRSAAMLPDRPSQAGLKPWDIRRALFTAIIADKGACLMGEIDRIVDEANAAIDALKKKITTAGTVTIPASEWADATPTIASVGVSGVDLGSIILMLPADEKTRLTASNAKLSAYPAAFMPVDGNSSVTILRAEAEIAPDADMTFAYIIIKTGFAFTSPFAAIVGVDAANGVDEEAVKELIDKEVPEWARAKQKPTYTPEEVKARPATWTPTAEEIGARPSTWMPTAADVGADSEGTAADEVKAHNEDGESHVDIRLDVTTIRTMLAGVIGTDTGKSMRAVAALVVAEIVGDASDSFDTLEEIAAWIEAHPNDVAAMVKRITDLETAIGGKVSKTDIINTLDSTALDKPLSAAMGAKLNAMLSEMSDELDSKATPVQVAKAISDALAGYALKDHNHDGVYAKPSDIPTVPQTLPNPYALTILGKTYTGGKAVSLTAEEIMEAIKTASGGVVAYLDGNRLVLSGNLPDATYTAYYEVNGELIEIGDLTLGSITPDPVTYTIRWVNYDDTVLEIDEKVPEGVTPEYNGATPTKPADNDYTYTFSGWADEKGNVGVVAATANAIYTAVYDKTAKPAEPTNFAIPNETNKTDWSIWCNDARFGSDGGYRALTGNVVTNYVAMEVGDIIRFTGLNVPTTGSSMNQGMHFSDADKTMLSATYLLWYTEKDYLDVTVNDGVYEVDTAKLVNHTKAGASKYFRISGTPTGTFDDVVINVKRNGAWL